jgi:hypothetical protein
MKVLHLIISFAICFVALLANAQSTNPQNLGSIASLPQVIGSKTLQQCTESSEGCKNLPVDVITAAASTPVPQASCNVPAPTPSPGKKEEDQTTILLVSELNSQGGIQGPTQHASWNYIGGWTRSEYPKLTQNNGSWPTQDLVKSLDGAIINGYGESYFDRMKPEEKEQFKQSLLISALADFTAHSPMLTDDEVATRFAETFKGYTSDREKQMDLLTRMSDFLYNNYNSKRNPMANTHHDPIATGNISLNQIVTAAYEFNPDQGGVCNDIAQSVAQVAAKMFPTDDALVINSGSHYALMVSEKNKVHTIIDGYERTTGKGEAIIDKDLPVTNTRISKVMDGKLKEIAITDTELGQVFKMVSGQGTEMIKTGYTPSVVMAEFKKGKNKFVAGVAKTSTSQVLVLVAQHKGRFLGLDSFTQAGVGGQKVSGEVAPYNVMVSFQEVLSKRIFNYVGPGVKVSGTGGAQFDASYGHGTSKGSLSYFLPSFSGNLQTFQKVDFQTTPQNPKNPTFTGSVGASQFLGWNDKGANVGAMSDNNFASVTHALNNTGLMFNQVSVKGGIQVPIQKGLSSQTDVKYQGTNIGQEVSITSGLNIDAPQGVKVFAFVGYMNSDIKGYLTNTSLLQDPTGFQAGAKLTTPKGVNLSSSVKGIGGTEGPQGQVTLGIPISTKKRKRAPASP